MNFAQITKKYVQALSIEVNIGQSSGEATDELSYRNSLGNYFKDIAQFINPEIATIPEPKNQGKIGRPDWRFHNAKSMGVYGYVEAKGIDSDSIIDIDNYKDQVNKYLTLGNPVILTDGVEFIIFISPTSFNRYSILEKPINWQSPEINYEVESLFRTFFNLPGFRSISENQIVKEVAKRARLLSSEVYELIGLNIDEAESESEAKTIMLLKNLKAVAEVNHDKSLVSSRVFSGFIAQILTFGLLYAHRVIGDSSKDPMIKYQEIHAFWFDVLRDEYSNKLMPFKSLVNELNEELNASASRLGIWYDDARRLLAHIRLTGNQIEKPDFHRLYEYFLSIYDPKTRFDYGAFYTPRELAKYQIQLSGKIAQWQFKSLDLTSDEIKYIDPCCGTGTYLEILLEQFGEAGKPKIVGFEILPAPYALAHYRMAMIADSYPTNVQIVLTNTLGDSLNNAELAEVHRHQDLFSQEQHKAQKLAAPPLTFIIGNPPSSDSQFLIENEGKQLKALIDDFRPPSETRRGRQNVQKQLKNEFVKFLRWSLAKAYLSKPSIVSLILPSSFAKHISYKYARKFLTLHFSQLWILEFDSDTRTGKLDQNLFATRQGRLLLVGVLDEKEVKLKSVNYKSILHFSKNEKITFFQNEDINLSDFTELEIDKEDYCFKPKAGYDRELYDQFWAVTDDVNSGIFLRHCSSLKLAPTHLLVHASAGQLKRRSKFISTQENSYEDIKLNWYSGQSKPPASTKLKYAVREKIRIALLDDKIKKYSYRPFTDTYILLDPNVLNELKNVEGGGTRDRPEIRVAFSDPNVKGFALAPAPEDIGQNIHKFSSFCWNIPDNDLSARGNAHVFCNYFPEYKKHKSSWDSSLKTNISPVFLKALSSIFDIDIQTLINPVLFYVYALTSCTAYLDQFKGKLFDVAGQWPRIPVTRNKGLFLEIAGIGETMANIEREDYEVVKRPNNIVFPKYSREFKLTSFSMEGGSLCLIGDKKEDILTLSNIPQTVLNFEVSGYKVLKEWLKMRTFAYYRKTFASNDYTSLSNLILKIDLYHSHMKELDEKFNQLMKEPSGLFHAHRW